MSVNSSCCAPSLASTSGFQLCVSSHRPGFALSSRGSTASFSRQLLQIGNVGSRHSIKGVVEWRAMATDNGNSAEDSKISSSTQEIGKVSTAVDDASPPSKGFGGSIKPGAGKSSKEAKKSGTIRRSAPQQPLLEAPGDPQAQQIETAYLLSLAFLGVLIFVQGLALAASGLLPDEWDEFLVKSVYPAFTPTVGLFLAGGAGYGLYKYLGGNGGK